MWGWVRPLLLFCPILSLSLSEMQFLRSLSNKPPACKSVPQSLFPREPNVTHTHTHTHTHDTLSKGGQPAGNSREKEFGKGERLGEDLLSIAKLVRKYWEKH